MATIELSKVEKKFGDSHAVKPLDLTINDGEFVVLLGPSGCGKTTTLRMISGLETVTSGKIIDGNGNQPDRLQQRPGHRRGSVPCRLVAGNHRLNRGKVMESLLPLILFIAAALVVAVGLIAGPIGGLAPSTGAATPAWSIIPTTRRKSSAFAALSRPWARA